MLAIGAAVQAAALAAPLLLSTDAWAYWAYGRISAVAGGNPYADTPADFPADPAAAWIGADWRDATSVYGPLFTLVSEPFALAVGTSAAAAAWLFKLAAALAVAGAMLLAARVSARPSLAAAFVGWNPLVALHAGGGGHNDAWVGALVLGALLLAARREPRGAGVAWAAAALVKWVPLVFLPLRALEARAAGRRVDHLGFAVTVAAIAGVATWRYGLAWLGAVAPLAANAAHETQFALPHRLEAVGVPDAVALAAAAAAFVAGYAWLARQAWRGRARLALAGALLLLTTPYLAAWYLAWLVPLAAVEEDMTARVLTFALCAYLLPQGVPL